MSEKPELTGSVVLGANGGYRDYNKRNDRNKHITNPKGFWDKNGKYRSGIKGRDGRQRKRCEAKKRTDGQPCQRWAMKNGRCRLHGGKVIGAQRGNKMALKTGEYETIWHDVLESDEVKFLERLKLDVESQLDEELKLITVRERRMMQRIQNLKDETFITTERSEESEEGFGKGGAIDVTKKSRKRELALKMIQSIEESLTRVQDKKAKLLDLKLKVQAESDGGSEALDGLVKILEASRNRVARTSKPRSRKKAKSNESGD